MPSLKLWIAATALLLTTACSSESMNVVRVGDLLAADGRSVHAPISNWELAEYTWSTAHRMPLVLPFSLSKLWALDFTVGTEELWRLAMVDGSGALHLTMPDEVRVERAQWRIRLHNDRDEFEFQREIPIEAVLKRAYCSRTQCGYRLEGDGTPENLLGFSVGATDLPVIPGNWPGPLAPFEVETTLTVHLEPLQASSGPHPMYALALHLELTSGETTAYLNQQRDTGREGDRP